jgi:hypothetical protein
MFGTSFREPEPNNLVHSGLEVDIAKDRSFHQDCAAINRRGPDSFPFTERKDSAEGTLSVSDALRVFTIRTLVATRESAANKRIIKSILAENRSRFLSTDFLL